MKRMTNPMTNDADNRQHVRRVVLPSGKTIEVVYFDELVPAVGGGPEATPEQLHICGSCASKLVYPLSWDEAGPTHWEVTLRCPDCEWTGTGVFEQSVVERFDEELDRGTEALVRDLKHMMHANMEDQIERFVSALQGDHILPDDF